MSKKDLKQYLVGLTKEELEDQIIDLYHRFKDVKGFYDFAFNPKEDRMVNDAKERIGKEYFPTTGRKPKKRRSVAQKLIKKFIQLEMAPDKVIDVMLFNIEVAQAANEEKPVNQEAFYKSMLKSFEEAVNYAAVHGELTHQQDRFGQILSHAEKQGWNQLGAMIRAWEEGLK